MNGCANDRQADQDDWVSVKRLAAIRGVTHQAVSKRVAFFMRKGLLQTRRAGKERLIHAPTFDALAAATHDPAQDLRLRNIKSAAPLGGETDPPPESGPSRKSAYDDASAREKNARAELAEMRLAQERGQLVPVCDLAPAVDKAATTLRQRIETLRHLAGRLYAAAMGGGEEAVALLLSEEINRILEAIRNDLVQLAAAEDDADSAV